jgi:phage anti-repressor protein
METYVIGEERNYSDFIKEIMSEEKLSNKGEEVLIEENRDIKKVTIGDYLFLAR